MGRRKEVLFFYALFDFLCRFLPGRWKGGKKLCLFFFNLTALAVNFSACIKYFRIAGKMERREEALRFSFNLTALPANYSLFFPCVLSIAQAVCPVCH
jgi:hypothetical protein